ncbi:MAG: hypothetical protein ISS82_01315 [Nanoarchaeota archaeon]|nr:hypothetical protein [Nanoarchaeota archaeon]
METKEELEKTCGICTYLPDFYRLELDDETICIPDKFKGTICEYRTRGFGSVAIGSKEGSKLYDRNVCTRT